MISKILLPDGTVLTSGPEERNAIRSVTLTQSVNAGTELTLGSVCSSMLEASVITPEGGLSLEAGTEVTLYQNEECVGLFTLEKPTRSSADTMKLVAYDRISRLDTDLTDWLSGLVDWPYSLYKLAWMVCAQCGLELENTELPNGDFQVQPFYAQGITGRQLMQWIGEATGRFCRATPEGKIQFAWFTDADVTIGTQGLSGQAAAGAKAVVDAPGNVLLQPVTQITSPCDQITLYHSGKNLLSVLTEADDDPPAYNAQPIYMKKGDRYVLSHNGTYNGWYLLLYGTTPTGETFPFQEDRGSMQFSNYYIRGAYTTSYNGMIYLNTASAYSGNSVVLVCNNDCIITGFQLLPYNPYGKKVFTQYQLERGTAVTEYEPYRGAVYTVDLPQTVTQGSFNWAAGKLTGEETVQLAAYRIPAFEGTNILYSNCGNTGADYDQLGFYGGSLSYEDYQVAPIEKVQIHLSNEDVGVVYPDVDAANTYAITGNYLLTANTTQSLLPVAQTLYEQLRHISYTPCRFSVPATDRLQAGQILWVTDRNGVSFRSCIMNKSRCAGRDTFSATGAASRQTVSTRNRQSVEALSGKVLDLRMQVEGLKAENRDAAGKAASLALDVEGIRAEVSRQENHSAAMQQQLTALEQTAGQLQLQVQTVAQEGVSRVVTETGFTFDQDGLTVGKTNSDLMNKITQQGMYVLRNDGTTMLRADAAGVVATDVSVGNYLIVGSHARLEDYTDGTQKRTACFYLGG